MQRVRNEKPHKSHKNPRKSHKSQKTLKNKKHIQKRKREKNKSKKHAPPGSKGGLQGFLELLEIPLGPLWTDLTWEQNSKEQAPFRSWRYQANFDLGTQTPGGQLLAPRMKETPPIPTETPQTLVALDHLNLNRQASPG